MAHREPGTSNEFSAFSDGETPEKHGDPDSLFSPRAALVTLLGLMATIFLVLILLQLFVARRIPEFAVGQLEVAERLWKQNGPAHYRMDIQLSGARPGTVHVQVRDGEVVAMTRDGHTPAKHTWNAWSVPGQFETLERELELAEDPVHEMQAGAETRLHLRCEFDSHYGFPRVYHRTVFGGGPEVYWRVTKFEAM